MEQIFDLPAHPLFVHAPLALMPIVAVLAAAILLRPAWRGRFGWVAVASVGALFVMVLLAMNSGEALEEAIETGAIERHEELAETTRLLVFLLLVVVTAGAVLARRVARGGAEGLKRVVTVLAGLTVVLGTLSTVWMIRTGHEGARVVWDGVIPEE